MIILYVIGLAYDDIRKQYANDYEADILLDCNYILSYNKSNHFLQFSHSISNKSNIIYMALNFDVLFSN